jgi:hypothetical protein
MAEIRAEIDRLDEDLVRLFAERAGFIDRADDQGQVDLIDGSRRRHAETAARKAVAAADRGPSPARKAGGQSRRRDDGHMIDGSGPDA